MRNLSKESMPMPLAQWSFDNLNTLLVLLNALPDELRDDADELGQAVQTELNRRFNPNADDAGLS